MGDYYPLGQRTTVVGRSESLPVQILDEHVSRKHLQIRYDRTNNQYYATDMNSRHGVLINGRRITGEVELQEDDNIMIGNTSILFTMKDFDNRENALNHFKKAGERVRGTIPDM